MRTPLTLAVSAALLSLAACAGHSDRNDDLFAPPPACLDAGSDASIGDGGAQLITPDGGGPPACESDGGS